MLDGYCEVVPPNELAEKERGLNVDHTANEPKFMKLTIARVVLYKKHYDFSLPKIIERKRALVVE